MEEKVILQVKNLSVLIKERFLVKGVTFSMKKGETLGIVGEDKSGKTSLIKAISGTLPISQGQILIDDVDISQDKSILVNGVGLCQDPPVFFKYQTVLNNMQYLCMLKGVTDNSLIIKTLHEFGLYEKMKVKVRSLSYFEKKLMALALAFIVKPKILLLDEPFKTLPEEHIEKIRKYIQTLKKQGTSIIVSSNSMEQIEAECDNFLFMDNREMKKYISKKDCEKLDEGKTFAFISVKYPHYAGKIIKEEYDIKVKLLDKRVLFDTDEDTIAHIVKFLTKKKIIIYKAGFLSNKAERIFANLAPYFKEEEA